MSEFENNNQDEGKIEDEIVIDEATKRMLIRNFFVVNKAVFPSWLDFYIKFAYLMFAIGFVFIVYFNTTILSIFIGAIFILLTVVFVLKWLKPYRAQVKLFEQLPTLEQMYAWLIDDIKTLIKPKALTALSLDESRLKPENFIIVPYPIFWNTSGFDTNDIKRRITSEGNYLYTTYKVQVLALTENYISLYTCNYNWIQNMVNGENTNEFFYDDISSIKNDMEKIENKPFYFQENAEEGITFQGLAAKIFRIRNMSGEVLSLITDIPEMQVSDKVSAKLNQVIQVLRFMLRNRRFGETYPSKQPEPVKIEPDIENTENNENEENGDEHEHNNFNFYN